ncbi:MAG: hypothetical protein E6J06_03720, partial [Chloroflexi bacterium]
MGLARPRGPVLGGERRRDRVAAGELANRSEFRLNLIPATARVFRGEAMDVFLAFHQTYQPVVGSIFLSALVAGLPLFVLFIMLAILRLPAWICALASLLTAAVLGLLVWGMPFGVTVGATTEGMAFGL